MIAARSIAEVIDHLDQIINWSLVHQSRIGYFAVLYRSMTIAVQQGILSDAFEDGERMAQLDVIFANRYLQAWEAYTNKQPCTTAWCAAFDACENNDLIVLQHLILGINTHINLDLAIAAAELCPEDKIHALKRDFDHINNVIADLTQHVQEALTKIWFPLYFLGKISRGRETAVLNFSINTARRVSWANALALANLQNDEKANYIVTMDKGVVLLAGKITNPGFFINLILKPVKYMESRDISKIIKLLGEKA
jgi:hypothetical protein